MSTEPQDRESSRVRNPKLGRWAQTPNLSAAGLELAAAAAETLVASVGSSVASLAELPELHLRLPRRHDLPKNKTRGSGLKGISKHKVTFLLHSNVNNVIVQSEF
jgi:hypothetical protein